MVARLDPELCERLMAGGARGDRSAAKKLIELLWPFWLNRVRTRPALRELGGGDDHVHNVVLRLVTKLSNPEIFDMYRDWREREAAGSFWGWMYTLTDHEVIDYTRTVIGRKRAPAPASPDDEATGDLPSKKALLNVFATSVGLEDASARPPYTLYQLYAEFMSFARERLPADQLDALSGWLTDASFDDLDAALGLEKGTARARVRAAIARLRREFGPESA